MSPLGNKPGLILGSGEDVPQVPPLFPNSTPLVVCADGGASLARRWGLHPSVIIGDLDSLDQDTKKYWESQGVHFRTFPTGKDQTDLDLAVDYAVKAGATSIVLTGAWGSRIDHSLGNLELLYRLALSRIPNLMLTKDHRLYAFQGQINENVRVGSIVSLLPLSPGVYGVTTEGLSYPLTGDTLRKGQTRSISNVATRANISIIVEQGVLLVVLEQ